MPLSRKSRAAVVSVASNATLVVMKLVVGILSGSVSIISEAIHSANDLVAAGIAFASTRVSDRPSDSDHPFGHGKAESISGAVEAALIMLAALWIVIEAVKRIVHGGKVEHLELGSAVMVVSAIVNTFVSLYLFKVAKEEDSLALEADAHHLSTDVITSLGVAVGLGIVWLTGWQIVDPIAAIAVAGLIASIGWKLTTQAGQQIMDVSLPPEEVARIEEILKKDSRIIQGHRLRTRKSGSDRQVDLHVALPGKMSLAEAHQVAREIETEIARLFPRSTIVVHTDPDTVLPGQGDGGA